jgi:hypothetical protein
VRWRCSITQTGANDAKGHPAMPRNLTATGANAVPGRQ